jgi:hypothetical protein
MAPLAAAEIQMRSTTLAALLDLPFEILTSVGQHLDPRDLVCVAAACKRLRHGDSGPEKVELPTKSPVIAALLQHAFPGGETIPSTRPAGCSESWVMYLARCARQRRCREAPPIAAGQQHSFFVDVSGHLLLCGSMHHDLTPVSATANVRVRSVAAGSNHGLALGCDGRVYSWGNGELG